MTKLTKRSVDALKPRDRDHVAWDDQQKGFGARVWPSGKITFIFKYRVGGGRAGTIRKPTIGTYGAMTVDQARNIAQDWSAEVRKGGDPAGARAIQRSGQTMAHLCDRYIKEYANQYKKSSSIRDDRRMIAKRIRPALGNRKVAEVTRADIMRIHGNLKDTPYEANRVLSLLSKAFNLAERWDMRPDGSNPCRHVDRYKEEKKERYLNPAELKSMADTLAQAELENTESPYVVAALRLLLFTGCRRSEILNLTWGEVDFDNARLNLKDSKTGAKIVFLSAPALEVLSSIPRVKGNPYVIVGQRKGAPLVNIAKPWSRIRKNASLRLWAEDPATSSFLDGLAAELAHKPSYEECVEAAARDGVEIPTGIVDIRLHDIRHTFASAGTVAGFSLPMIGKMLGHTNTATTARYAHLAADPVRQATETVAGQIAAAMKGEEAEVIEMAKRER